MQINLPVLKKYPIERSVLKNLSTSPGIYVFWQKNSPIYVGKAINLQNRLKSYFAHSLGLKTFQMMKKADHLSILKVEFELEALLLEARLIRNLQPKYNFNLKDDKHALYILISKEKYPRILTVRKLDEKKFLHLAFFGPFPSSQAVYTVLKLIRKLFPYSDHKISGKACFYSHLGLCNPCPSMIEKIRNKSEANLLRKSYLNNIRLIKMLLSGKVNTLSRALNQKMLKAAVNLNFEEAASLKKQIDYLNYIVRNTTRTQAFLENPNLNEDIRAWEIRELQTLIFKYSGIKNRLKTIECFDVSHLQGATPTASLVSFIEAESEKSAYKRFKIRQEKTQSDTDSLREVATRRLKRLEDWGRPDLVIVDGGKPQVKIFADVFAKEKIPVVGIAKKFETLVILQNNNFQEVKLKGYALNLIQRIRDEAHRFAQKYHHLLFKENLLKVS